MCMRPVVNHLATADHCRGENICVLWLTVTDCCCLWSEITCKVVYFPAPKPSLRLLWLLAHCLGHHGSFAYQTPTWLQTPLNYLTSGSKALQVDTCHANYSRDGQSHSIKSKVFSAAFNLTSWSGNALPPPPSNLQLLRGQSPGLCDWALNFTYIFFPGHPVMVLRSAAITCTTILCPGKRGHLFTYVVNIFLL